MKTIEEHLSDVEISAFHSKVLDLVRDRTSQSRAKMERHYSEWDTRDETFRGVRTMDKDDRNAAKHGEPVKLTVPLTYAQVQSFVSFCFLLFTQNKRFFEYIPTGSEDHEIRNLVELVVERDLRHNNWPTLLFQFLLNVSKYGVGIFKHTWTEEYQHVKVTTEQTATMVDGINVSPATPLTSYEKFIKFQGNKIVGVSPYKFLPDTRLPLTRFQEGEFCASEEERSILDLKRLEQDGVVYGVNHIEHPNTEDLEDLSRRRTTYQFGKPSDKDRPSMVLLTEMQIKLIPADFEVDGEFPLGKEEFPIIYIVWMANDNRIIRMEPAGYLHDSFTYDVAQLTPDEQHDLNASLTDTISGLQDVFDWFVNSRVASVRRTLDNQLVVDPTHVDMDSVSNRSRVIKLKRNASGGGINKYIQQLNVTDVTSGHMNDANQLMSIMQMVTGVSDNAMGQFSSGRRSATEARAVNQGGSSRLRMICQVIWSTAMNPLGKKLALNLRDGLDPIQFQKIVGEKSKEVMLFPQFKSTPAQLIGGVDFFVFDGTLPTEKGFLAQSLQELLIAIMSNPQIAVQFDINPKTLMEEINSLRGVYNLDRFSLSADPQAQQQLIQQLQQPMLNGPSPTQPPA
jgi:hypothetical protein